MIKMNAFTREPDSLIHEQIASVERVLRSGWWVLGKEVEAFEKEWSEWSGCRHTVGVGNGMDALEIGLRAINIGSGDEVITTPMTAFATVCAIMRAGAVPVFADIDPHTAILSTESVRRCMNTNTKAVIVVHLYGQAAPLDEYVALCKENGLYLIEDCAQAHGAISGEWRVGTAGIFAGWSFYPTKNLGAIGDGGALSTESSVIAEKAKQLRNDGQSVRYHHPHLGLNSRLDELQAAILRIRLEKLVEWTSSRRRIAEQYTDEINNSHVRLLPLPPDEKAHVHHLFVIGSTCRDRLAEYLKENGIETLVHYPIPVHQQEPCKEFKRDPCGLANAERHARECLSIPCNPFLKDSEIRRIIDTINSFRG